MAKWSDLWSIKASRAERSAAVQRARFTPPSPPTRKAKGVPSKQAARFSKLAAALSKAAT